MTASRSVQCPSCGGSIELKAAGYTVNVGCQYCGSMLDVASPDVKLISEYHQAARNLALPLGSRGTLAGVEWEAIGFMERSDSESRWHEYLLFNPYAGYRWLVHSEGSWTYGTMLPEAPVQAGDSASWRGAHYAMAEGTCSTRTDYVVGEFYWRVQTGDTVEAGFYESDSGTSLSCEKTADETNWTLIEELPSGIVEANFRGADGTALNFMGGAEPVEAAAAPQEFSSQIDSENLNKRGGCGSLFRLSLITLIAAFAAMFAFGRGAPQADKEIAVALDGPAQTFTVGTVTVTRAHQAVTVTATALDQWDNKWIDLDYSLVDKQSQQALSAYGVVEHYSGSDSDGSWTEGDYQTTTKFGGVTQGTYDLVVEASAHSYATSTSSSSYTSSAWGNNAGAERYRVNIKAETGGLFYGNLILIAILLLVPMIVLTFRTAKRSFKVGSGGGDD